MTAAGGRAADQALQGRGLLGRETHDHALRIAPPLVITEAQVDWALDQFDAALRGIGRRFGGRRALP